MNWLIEKVSKKLANKQIWVSDLTRYITDLIRQHPNYDLVFPVCISLDNCVGYFTPSNMDDDDVLIKENSVIKLELKVYDKTTKRNLLIGETIFPHEHDKIKRCFDEIKNTLTSKKARAKVLNYDSEITLTTDDLRLFIESHLAEYNLTPLKNCISHQSTSSLDPNYFYLNYVKEYDSNDYLIPLPNFNFDILPGDIYDINITVTNGIDAEPPIKFVKEPGNVYKVHEDLHRSLKTKAAKQLAFVVKKEEAFDFETLDLSKVGMTKLSSRFGLKECVTSGFLEEYPVYYTKDKRPVFHLKFTVTF